MLLGLRQALRNTLFNMGSTRTQHNRPHPLPPLTSTVRICVSSLDLDVPTWVLVPSESGTVADVVQVLSEKLDLPRHASSYLLFLRGAVLLSSESASLIRDGDEITIRKKPAVGEKRSRAFLELPNDTLTEQPAVAKPPANHQDNVPLDGTSMDTTKTTKLEKLKEIATSPRLRKCPRTSEDASEHSRTLPAGSCIVEKENTAQEQVAASLQGDIEIQEVPLTSSQAASKVAEIAGEPVKRKKATEVSIIEDLTSLETPQAKFVEGAEPIKARSLASLPPLRALSKVSDLEGEPATSPGQRGVPSLRSVPVPDLSPTNSPRLSHEPSSGFLTAGPLKVQNQHSLHVHHRDVTSMRTLDIAPSTVSPLRSKPAVQSPTFKERKASGGPTSSVHQRDKPSLNETQSADLPVPKVSGLAREPVKTKATKVPSLRSELAPSSSFNNSPHLGNISTSPRRTNMPMAHSEPTARSPKVNAPKLRSEPMPEPKHIVSATSRGEVTPNSPTAPIDSAPQASASGQSKLSSGPVGSNVLRLRSEPAPVASQKTSGVSAPRNDIESVSAGQTPNETRSPVDKSSFRERSSGSAPLTSLAKKTSTPREQSAAERENKDTQNADRTEIPPSQQNLKEMEMNKTQFQRASGLKVTKARRRTASAALSSPDPIALDQGPANLKAGPKDSMVVKIKVPSTASSATESKKAQPSESVGRTRQRFPSAFKVTKARRRTAFSTPPAAPETPPKYSDTDPELASKSASQQMPKILSNSAHASDNTKALVDSLSLHKTPQIAESHLSSLSVQSRESSESVLPLTGKGAPRSPGTSRLAKDNGVRSNLKPTATSVSSSALQTDENPEVTYSNPSEKATTALPVTPGSDLDFAKDTLLQKLREVEESGMFTFESEAPPSTSAGTERNDGSDDVKAQVTGQTCFEFVSSVPENDTRQVEGEINFNFNMAQTRDDSSSESKPVQHLEPTEENQGATQAAATPLNQKQKERENEVSVRNVLSSMEDPGPKKSASLVCDVPEDVSTEGRARRRPFQPTPPRRPSLEPPPKNSAKQDARPVDAGFGIDSQNVERGPFQPTAPRHLVPPNSPPKNAETKDSCSPNTGAGSDSKIAEISNVSSAPRASEVMLDATTRDGSSPSHRLPFREKQADSKNEISAPRLTEKESRYIEEENYNESYIVGRKEIERANRTNNFTQPPPRQKYMKGLSSETRAGDTAKFIPQSAHSRPFRGNSTEEIQASGSAKSSRISPERSLPKNAVFVKPMATLETSSTLKSQAKNQSPSMRETFMKMLETTSSFDKDYEVFCQVQVLLDIDSSLERPSRWVPCLFHRRPEDKEHLRIIGITPETLSALKLTGDLTKQTLRNGKIVSGAALTAYFPLIIDVRVLHNFDFTAFHGDRTRLLRLSDGIRQEIRDLSSPAVRSKEQQNSAEQPSHSSNKAKSSELRNVSGESELGSVQSPSAVNAADMDTETAKQSCEAVTESVKKSPPGAMDAIAPMLDDLQNMQGVPDFGKDDGEPFLLPSLEAVDSVLETTTPMTEDGMQYAESSGPAHKNNSHSQADGIQSSELKLGGDYGTNAVGPVENESDSQRHKQKPPKVKCITQVRTGSTFDAAANTLSRIEKCAAEIDDSASKPSPDIVLLSPLESPKQTASEPEPFVPNINQIEPLPAKSTSTISSRKKLEDIDYSDFTSCMIQILSEASKSLHNLVDKEQMLLSRIVERR